MNEFKIDHRELSPDSIYLLHQYDSEMLTGFYSAYHQDKRLNLIPWVLEPYYYQNLTWFNSSIRHDLHAWAVLTYEMIEHPNIFATINNGQ